MLLLESSPPLSLKIMQARLAARNKGHKQGP